MNAITPVAERSRTDGVSQPRLVQAAHEFEAQLMKELLRPMVSRDDEVDCEAGSSSALADFAGEALGQALSARGGFGVASSVLQSLSRNGIVQRADQAAGR